MRGIAIVDTPELKPNGFVQDGDSNVTPSVHFSGKHGDLLCNAHVLRKNGTEDSVGFVPLDVVGQADEEIGPRTDPSY